MTVRKIVQFKETFRTENLAEFFILCTIFVVSALTQPIDIAPFTICLFKNITGIPCPGCGMTRAFLFLGHGQFIHAWQMNPLSYPVAFLLFARLLKLLVLLVTHVEYNVELQKYQTISLAALSYLLVAGTWISRSLVN